MAYKNILVIIFTLLFIGLSIGLLSYVLVNKDPSSSLTNNSSIDNSLNTQSKNTGAVTIAVTPVLIDSGYEFNVELDTHSVELNYDLTAVFSLTNEQNQVLKPVRWEGDPKGGHHRKGTLILPKFDSQPKTLNLTINKIDGQDLNFRWDIN